MVCWSDGIGGRGIEDCPREGGGIDDGPPRGGGIDDCPPRGENEGARSASTS
jgi:hypothetical protein